MEIISVMMTLIIFLFIISMLIVMIFMYKIKAKGSIRINGARIDISFEIMNKKHQKSKQLKAFNTILEKMLNTNNIKKLDEKNKKIESLIREIHNITSIVNVDFLKMSFLISTPFVGTTVFSTVLLSSVIPIIHQNFFDGKGRLMYKVIPEYNEFKFEGDIEFSFFITSFQILLIYIWWKKKKKTSIQLKFLGKNKFK